VRSEAVLTLINERSEGNGLTGVPGESVDSRMALLASNFYS